MSRVINPQPPGKIRQQLLKSCAAAADVLLSDEVEGDEILDLGIFLHESLLEIAGTIETTVVAWEKRDYWVKADQFRSQWAWVERLAEQLLGALDERQWAEISAIGRQVREQAPAVKAPKKIIAERPWQGAWDAYQSAARQDLSTEGRPGRPG